MADKKDETQGSEIPDEEKLSTNSAEADQLPEETADIVDADFEEIRDETGDDPAHEAETDVVDAEGEEPTEEVSDDPVEDVEDTAAEPEPPIEPEPPVEPEPVVEPEPAPPAPKETVIEKTIVQNRGAFPLILGGVIAAILGFGAARLELPPGVEASLPEALRAPDFATPIAALEETSATQGGQITETGQQLTDLTASVETLTSGIADLDARLSALQIPDISPLEQGIASLGDDLAAAQSALSAQIEAASAEATKGIENLTLRLGALDVRVSALEKRPITENLSDEAIAAYERELDMVRRALADERDNLRDSFDELIKEQGVRMAEVVDAEKDRINGLLADAQAMVDDANVMADKTAKLQEEAMRAQAIAAAQSSVALVRGALAEGDPFADNLGPIADAGVEVPAVLSDTAEDGVPTQGLLTADFAPAARDALDAARYSDPEATKGLGAFLQRQLGARSTTPQEGDNTDAILSRAEAALNREDLTTALIELEALPDVAATEMAGWVELATTRRDALAAIDSVAADLNTN